MCSLLILMALWGCGEGGAGGSDGPAPAAAEITRPKLDELIRSSSRPYVLVNFYATWCGPCRKEMPSLVALQNDPASEVEVIFISIDEAGDIEKALPGFLTEMGVNFKTWFRATEADAFVRGIYAVWDGRIPLSLLYSNKGQLIEPIHGLTTEKEIKMVIEQFKMLQDV